MIVSSVQTEPVVGLKIYFTLSCSEINTLDKLRIRSARSAELHNGAALTSQTKVTAVLRRRGCDDRKAEGMMLKNCYMIGKKNHDAIKQGQF